MSRITVDDGHNYSGWDTGAVNSVGDREQDETWQIGSRYAKLCRDAVHQVQETRPLITTNVGKNANDSVNVRIKMCNEFKSDIVVCIHENSFADSKVEGSEAWVNSLGGRAEKLANEILPRICAALGTKNRGVKVNAKAYGILRDTDAPAVLLECGFLSNANDEVKLDKYDVIAKAIYEGTQAYFGVPAVFKSVVPAKPVVAKPTTPVIAKSTTMVVNTKSQSLYLLKGPGTGAKLTLMPKGSVVTLVDKNNPKWYKVKYKTLTGYASTAYLK